MKYCTNNKAWTTTNICTEFLQVPDASTGVEGRKLLVACRQLCCSSTRCHFYTSKISVLSTKLHRHNAFYEDWVFLDFAKDVNFSSDTSVDKELATGGISGTRRAVLIQCGSSSSHGEKEKTTMTLNQWQVLLRSMLFKKLLNHSSMHMALTGVMNRIFWTEIGSVSSEAECFKLISCELNISLEKKNIILTWAHLMLFTQLLFYSIYHMLSRVPSEMVNWGFTV